jgi:DsbC/DsbD-like thiol-disulfide interchange protein
MLRISLSAVVCRLLSTAALVAPLAAAAQGMPGGSAGKAGPVVTTDQVRAELGAHAPQGIGEGQPFWLGLFITHQPLWHTYWKNPGDSGLPTRLTWTLPPGFVAGDIQWPTPKQLPVGPLLNYGFDGELLLPVQVAVPPGFKGDAVDVKLEAMWLVCKDVCIPESGEFQLRVPARAATALHGARFDATLAAQPRPAEGAVTTAKVDGDALVIEAKGLPASLRGKEVAFFAEQAGAIEHAAKPQQRWSGDALSLRVPLSAQRSESPAAMQAVLTVPGQVRIARLRPHRAHRVQRGGAGGAGSVGGLGLAVAARAGGECGGVVTATTAHRPWRVGRCLAAVVTRGGEQRAGRRPPGVR